MTSTGPLETVTFIISMIKRSVTISVTFNESILKNKLSAGNYQRTDCFMKSLSCPEIVWLFFVFSLVRC